MVQILMLSDEWLLRYEFVQNLHIKLLMQYVENVKNVNGNTDDSSLW